MQDERTSMKFCVKHCVQFCMKMLQKAFDDRSMHECNTKMLVNCRKQKRIY